MKQTAMQDLKEDLEQSLVKINESFDEINNKLIRDVVKEAIRITFVEIVKRIDEELLEIEKQQIIDFADKYGFDVCGYDYDRAEQYYNETFKK
jgi:uncharacterized Zn finger protein